MLFVVMTVMRLSAIVGRRAMVHLQFVVFGKVHHEIPGHHVVGTQVVVDDDASHTIGTAGYAPG
jgi:hypothetical protein